MADQNGGMGYDRTLPEKIGDMQAAENALQRLPSWFLRCLLRAAAAVID